MEEAAAEEELCCICLAELRIDEMSVASIDCNSCNSADSSGASSDDHCFHALCIKKWVLSSSRGEGQSRRFLPKCPLCKQSFKTIVIAGRERISVAAVRRSAAAKERAEEAVAGRMQRTGAARGRAATPFDFFTAEESGSEEEEEQESIGLCIVCDEHCIRGDGESEPLFCACGQCVHTPCLARSFGRRTPDAVWTCFVCQNVEIYRQRKRRLLLQLTPSSAVAAAPSLPAAAGTTRDMVALQISRARRAALAQTRPTATPGGGGQLAGSSAVTDALRLLEAVKGTSPPGRNPRGEPHDPYEGSGPGKKRSRSQLLREMEEDIASGRSGATPCTNYK